SVITQPNAALFEMSNLAAGKHKVKIAGLIGEFQIVQTTGILSNNAALGWVITEVSVGVVIVILLLASLLIIRRSQRFRSQVTLDDVIQALRRKNRE
ncbi:hypothetical protein ACFLTW_05830, partial [Chloroflexota bacterium]